MAKDISISIKQDSITPGSEFDGTVVVSYNGRFDGVQINTYVVGTNEHVSFSKLNGKQVSVLARLFVGSAEITGNVFDFAAIVDRKEGLQKTSVRFRATIIQQHKEVAGDTLFVPLVP